MTLGRTETVRDKSSTSFAKGTPCAWGRRALTPPPPSQGFVIPYFFERTQTLRFVVYDEDDPKSASLDKHDCFGEVVVTVAAVMATGGAQTIAIRSTSVATKVTRFKGRLGQVIVKMEQVAATKPAEVFFHLMGVNLDKKDLIGKSVRHKGRSLCAV